MTESDDASTGVSPLSPGVPSPLGDDVALRQADLADATRELEAAERRSSRHLLWAALGLSPAALIPFVGLLAEGSFRLIIVLVGLVFLIEGFRYVLSQREVRHLHAVVKRLSASHPDPIEDPSGEVAS